MKIFLSLVFLNMAMLLKLLCDSDHLLCYILFPFLIIYFILTPEKKM